MLRSDIIVKITKEEFDILKPKCGCINNELIPWKERYKKRGVPKYIHGHNSNNPHIKSIPKVIKEEFDKLKPRCNCPCNELIPWKEYYMKKGIPKFINGHNSKNRKRIFTEEHIIHMSESHIGKYCGLESPHWKGGISFDPYCDKFNEAKREEVRNKYDRKCFICNLEEKNNLTKNNKVRKLSVHHIDGDKEQGCNDKPWFLVPLCIKCHIKTISKKTGEYWIIYIQTLLKFYAIKDVWSWWNSYT